MRRAFLVSVLGLLIAALPACSSGGAGSDAAADDSVAADSLTRRQKDSAVAESGLPGARGVEGAMDASDAARERAARLDSLDGE